MTAGASSGTSGTLAPWLAAPLAALLRQRGHAWLLHGPSGLGQYDLALALASAWLCEHPGAHGACGQCASCHAIAVRTHADLRVLMPEGVQMAMGWPLGEKAQSEIDDKKRKPSREIRVEAMRDAVEFAQRTSARGRGKVVLVYPAEDMNTITANALLKTLEEPVGDVRFVLASSAAHQLLPTIRSRCLGHALAWPSTPEALTWLTAVGMDPTTAATLLKAAGGRPADALEWHTRGHTGQEWIDFPAAMAQGNVALVKDWTVQELMDALHKLCHDLLAVHTGAVPRFFESSCLKRTPRFRALSSWSRALTQARRTMDHPYNAGLMLETLVSDAQIALHSSSRNTV